ncbi:MAG: DUF3540 domain-containing protein [Proteobacteria bacterium]|nr:DUF3540 domain-containing protein [Pseudomonadota bacterium]
MNNLAHDRLRDQPFLEYGRVTTLEGEAFAVETDFGRLQAKRSAGCLIKPMAGDAVLLSLDRAGRCYILSVLERAASNADRLDLDFKGQVNLNVSQGGLTLKTDGNLSLIGGEDIALASEEISVSARRGEAFIGDMSFVGRFLKTQVERIDSAAVTVEHAFKRLTQRLGNAFRFIKEHEEVQTGSTRYLVEDLLAMHTKNTDLTSEEIVKIMAEQIHLG